MKKFSPTDVEQNGIHLEDLGVVSGREECGLSLLGKVYGEKMVNITGIRSFACNIWKYPTNLKIVELGPNLFQFTFQSKQDMAMVMEGKSWIYDGQPLIVQQ